MTGTISLLFYLLCPSVQCYYWDMVEHADDYHPDVVYHQSQYEGTQAVCRIDMWASGRDHDTYDTCYIPSGNEEHPVSMPYETLVRDPVKEAMVWVYTTNAAEIRENAVVVCTNCDPEPEMYVCAVSDWGPGKLVIWGDNEIVCYVAWYWEEHEFHDSYQVLTVQPAYEYYITEVNYYLDDLSILADNPLHMAEATLINNDNSDHIIVHTLVYSKSSTNEWQNGYGFTLGTAIRVSAGIPFIVDTEWEISTEQTFEYSYGESHTETIEVSLQAQVLVPAKHSCTVSIVARQMLVDVPYDATVTIYYPDDTSHSQYITGVYEGLSVSQDTVQIDECVPLSPEYLNYSKK